MKVTILGASGATGRQLVSQALEAGMNVTAVARRQDALSLSHPNLTVIAADVTDARSLAAPVEGAAAVLSALGSRQGSRPTTLYSTAAVATLAAMAEAAVTRLICVSAVPAEPDELKSPLERYLVHPLLYRFFGGSYADMRRMEAELCRSSVDWTVFRPPYLTNVESSGRYRMAIDAPLKNAWSLSRADLAAAMLDAITNDLLIRHAVTIAN